MSPNLNKYRSYTWLHHWKKISSTCWCRKKSNFYFGQMKLNSRQVGTYLETEQPKQGTISTIKKKVFPYRQTVTSYYKLLEQNWVICVCKDMFIQLSIEFATWKNYKIKGYNKVGLFEGSFFIFTPTPLYFLNHLTSTL